MRSGLALVLAPSIALVLQSVLYGLVLPACEIQTEVAMHAVAAAGVLVTLGLAALAWRDRKARHAQPDTPDSDDASPRSARRFLAIVATGMAALSALVLLVMWFNVWVLSPCAAWP